MKNTKRALLTSVLALVMCVVMLVGSTFAWFTDSAVSYNNKIVAGKLDVQLFYHYLDANNVEQVVEITNESDPIFGNDESIVAQNVNEDTLWEPGKTQAAFLEIKNNGNLALKYQVAIEVRNDAKDLYEAMQYTVVPDAKVADGIDKWADLATEKKTPTVGMNAADAMDVSLGKGDSHFFALAIHMLEEAGNEYQEGEVSFDIKVLATQDTVEADYYDNQYDKDAEYPVVTAAELEAAIAAGEPIIALADDITVAETIAVEKDLEINLQGYSLDTTKAAGRALKVTADDVDLVINAEGAESTFGNGTYGIIEVAANVKNANVTVNGGKFTGETNEGAFVRTRDGASGTITLNDVTFIDNCFANTGKPNAYVVCADGDFALTVNGGYYESAVGFGTAIAANEVSNITNATVVTEGTAFELSGTSTIDNCDITVKGVRVNSLKSGIVYACGQGTVTIKNSNLAGKPDVVYGVFPTGGTIIAENNSIKNMLGGVERAYAYDQYAGCTASIIENGKVRV